MIAHRRLMAAIALILCAPLIDTSAWLFALQEKASSQPAQARQKTAKEQPPDLAKEIHELTKELRELHTSQRRILDLMLLQIEQERAEKLEAKLYGVEMQLKQLMAEQGQLEWKLSHLDEELQARNIVNRQEGEKIVRAELQNRLDQVRESLAKVEADEQRLSRQAEASNKRLELLRTHLGPEEENPAEPSTVTVEPETQNPK